MSGHRSSRRREYGRRQKEVRDRRTETPSIGLDAPVLWVRGRAWDGASGRPSAASSPFRDGSAVADGSSGSQGR